MLERGICAGVYYVRGKRAKTAETLSKEEKSVEKFKKIKRGFLKHFERNGYTDGQCKFMAPSQSNF